jgi:hypothetical protein
MKPLITVCLLIFALQSQGQAGKQNDSIPLINDYSNFNNKPQKKIYYKLFDKVSKDSSLIIVDGKIFRPDSATISKFTGYRPKLVTKIIDENSSSGIRYIYIYKSSQ